MMPDEKTQLLSLFDHRGAWCRAAEAQDANRNPVHYDDQSAVAWDITGALCRLFGWKRACVLFKQLERHFVGKPQDFSWPPRDTDIDAMKALQDFNDRSDTTFDLIREQLEAMPVWRRGCRADRSARGT